jgi:hypothetical protein
MKGKRYDVGGRGASKDERVAAVDARREDEQVAAHVLRPDVDSNVSVRAAGFEGCALDTVVGHVRDVHAGVEERRVHGARDERDGVRRFAKFEH